MSIINYSGFVVEIIKKPIKHCYLRLKSDGNLVLTVNKFITPAQIESILNKNITKFSDRAKLLRQNNLHAASISYIWHLGNQYPITIGGEATNQVKHTSTELLIKQAHINDSTLTKRLILEWQLKEAKQIFVERFNIALQLIKGWNVELPTLRVRYMQSRFGSYSRATNNVCLNAFLVKAPIKFTDYVIAHELSHIRHFNHSKSFYSQLEELYPHWHNTRTELRQLARQYLFN